MNGMLRTGSAARRAARLLGLAALLAGCGTTETDWPASIRLEPDIELLLVPAGHVPMGSPTTEIGRDLDEEPRARVRIVAPFYLARTEVTQSAYEQVMGTNPASFKEPARPVETVSWLDATAFCARLGERESPRGSLPRGYVFRLPTEAEWEMAARADGQTSYSFGESDAPLSEHGWYLRNAGGRTHPVAGLSPNPWGFFDMHGNVAEWCADLYAPRYPPEPEREDAGGPREGSYRVLRGGAWYMDAIYCRSADRDAAAPEFHHASVGFRLAMGRPLEP